MSERLLCVRWITIWWNMVRIIQCGWETLKGLQKYFFVFSFLLFQSLIVSAMLCEWLCSAYFWVLSLFVVAAAVVLYAWCVVADKNRFKSQLPTTTKHRKMSENRKKTTQKKMPTFFVNVCVLFNGWLSWILILPFVSPW